MRIVYFGSSGFGIPSLEQLRDSRHRLVHIFTQPAQPAGRGRQARPTPVSQWAAANGVPRTEAANINTPEMFRAVAMCQADLLVVIAFGQKISNEVLALFPKGAINVHASLLPEYRGAAPIHRAIIDGKTETGISIITVAERMDAGDIWAQASTPIQPDDTAETVHDRLADIAAPVLLETVDRIEAGTAEHWPQDESRVTLAKKLRKTEGHLDFGRSAEALHNRIRGLWPWPGAQALYISLTDDRQEPVTIASSRVIRTGPGPAERIGVFDENLHVICGRDRLEIGTLKPAGKKLMDFLSFANGRQVRPGDRLAPPPQG